MRHPCHVTRCGSSDGIGFATARLCARLGANGAITSTTPERIEARARELLSEGRAVYFHVADLADREQAFGLVSAAHSALGPIDVLVNGADMVQTGVHPVDARLGDLSPNELQRELDITLTGS